MTPKTSAHIIKGMQKDTSESKLSKEFVFDAKNIRITAREDNSLLSITNEKGNKAVDTLGGDYLGHCILNNQVIFFLKRADHDYIVLRSNYNEDANSFETTEVLYNGFVKGNLNFNLNNPIETLGVYENEDIQKVYWVDGLNQPRVINIKASEEVRSKWTNTSFDFIPELALQESISVEAISSSSMFAPGVIQYAFSYYNKYGQESNIFDVTPLCYIAHKERGASPEEVVKDIAFKIRVSNVDTNFDYIRIYSIHRTSLNAVPTVKRVIDLPVSISEEITEEYYSTEEYKTSNNYTLVYDNKLITDAFSKQEFPGNTESNYSFLLTIPNEKVTIEIRSRLKKIGEIIISGNFVIYSVNTIKIHNTTFTTQTLKFSDNSPGTLLVKEFIDNSSTPSTPSIEYIDNGTLGETIDPTQLLYIGGENIIAGNITQKDNTLFLGNIKLTQQAISEDIKKYIKNANISPVEKTITYKNNYSQFGIYINENSYYKPREHYRLGIQFQYKNGKWLEPLYITDYTISSTFGPSDKSLSTIGVTFPEEIKELLRNNKDLKKFRPLVVFPDSTDRKIIAQGILCSTLYNIENRLYNNPYCQSSWFLRPNVHEEYNQNTFDNDSTPYVEQGAIVEFRHGKSLINGANRGAEIQNDIEYKVDQSVLNFYSPELEFNNDFSTEGNIKMRIVGIVPFNSNYGDIDIQTSTPTYSSNALGFKKYLVSRTTGGERSLVSGLFYTDSDMTIANRIPNTKFLIYPWHRSGSLNSDTSSNAASENRVQSSILKKKRISNIKISNETRYFSASKIWEASGENSDISLSNGISKVTLCDNNQTLVKIEEENNDILNYFPTIDTLLNGNTEIVIGDTTEDFGIYSTLQKLKGSQSAPVRITYKTSPHCVFKLNKDINDKQVILPSINGINNINNKEISDIIIVNKDELELGEEIQFKQNNVPESASIGNLWIDTSKKTRRKSGEYGTTIIKQKVSSDKGGNGDWIRYYPQNEYSYCHYYKSSTIVEIFKGVIVETVETKKFWDKYKTLNLRVETSDTRVIIQDDISVNMPTEINKPPVAYLYMAELYKDEDFVNNAFGGISDVAIKNNLWLPASKSIILDENSINKGFIYDYGDTYYQRYDCLKTYAFTPEDENQVIEIASFMCETRVNMLGRYDKNIGNLSNLNADPTNFNLFNPIYSQRDNFFNYRILDSDIYKLNKFPNSITWSKEKHLGEDVDTWTNITMANTLDLDGTKGKVNKLVTFNEQIFAFQDKGISNILFNSRVQIPVSDGVPIEITNGYKVEGSRYISTELGCQNKYSIQVTPSGIYFLDSESGGIYLLGGEGLTNLSTNKGFDIWTKEVAYDSTFKTFYDKNNKDIYFVTKDYCLGYSEKLGQFTSFYDYNGVDTMFNIDSNFFTIKNVDSLPPFMWVQFKGEYNRIFNKPRPYSITYIENDEPLIDKVFTNIEYRADAFDSNNNYLADVSFDTITAWNEYQEGKETLVFSKYRPSNLKKKFRMWRANIPRDNTKKLDRMRNPWLFIKLSKENPSNERIELHDMLVYYFQ